MSDPAPLGRLRDVVAELEGLADRLERGDLDAPAATGVLERAAALARELAEELERRGEDAEGPPAP